MTDEKKSFEEWMAEEQARLDKGFEYEPEPSSGEGKPKTGDEILAGLGLGAAVAGGAVAPHPNPVTLEGVKVATIVKALESEIADDDTRVEVDRTANSTVVTFLQSQEDTPYQFSPALSATLIQTADTLTVTLSDLNQDVKRGTISSVGSTLLEQGKRVLTGRSRGIGGLMDAAGGLVEGVDDVVGSIQDLGLPKRVWKIIDRVGGAAEEVHLDQQRKERELQRRREEALRAWTHCPACGRAYREDEDSRVDCPSCGATRGDKPV
jgi:hypothetical protein